MAILSKLCSTSRETLLKIKTLLRECELQNKSDLGATEFTPPILSAMEPVTERGMYINPRHILQICIGAKPGALAG